MSEIRRGRFGWAAGAVGFAAAVATLLGAGPQTRRAPGLPADPLVPDTALEVPGGPALVLEAAKGLPAAGIRISAPHDPYRPGAAMTLVALALDRARPLADLVGASLWGGVEHGRIAYHVIGDLGDVDELAWIARLLASRPSREGLRAASTRRRAHADRVAETPHGRVVAAIDGLSGGHGGEGSGAAAAQAGGFAEIENLWERSHARDRLRVFVLGDVPVPVALSELSFVGAPAGGRAVPAVDSAGAVLSPGAGAPATEAGARRRPAPTPTPPTTAWAGAFFSLGYPGDPAALVGQQALAAGLRGLNPRGVVVRVQHGLGESARWTAVTATALAQREADAALAEVLSLMSAAALGARWAAAAEAAQGDLLAAASTAAGWLRLADRHYRRAGFARGAATALETVGKPELDAVAATFESSLVRLGGGR